MAYLTAQAPQPLVVDREPVVALQDCHQRVAAQTWVSQINLVQQALDADVLRIFGHGLVIH